MLHYYHAVLELLRLMLSHLTAAWFIFRVIYNRMGTNISSTLLTFWVLLVHTFIIMYNYNNIISKLPVSYNECHNLKCSPYPYHQLELRTARVYIHQVAPLKELSPAVELYCQQVQCSSKTWKWLHDLQNYVKVTNSQLLGNPLGKSPPKLEEAWMSSCWDIQPEV